MLDIKFIRENPEKVKEGCQRKEADCPIGRLLEVDKQRRELLQNIEELKSNKNKLGRSEIEEAKKIKEQIKKQEPTLNKIEEEYDQLMRKIPNLPLVDLPQAKIVRQVGEKPKFDFPVRDYLSLGEKLDLIDIQRAAKASGSRFGYLKGQAVLWEFALAQLAFNVLGKAGFRPVIPPVMLKEKPMRGMGYLDQNADEVYHLPKDNLYLVGTSEQSIGAMHMNETLPAEELPKRYLGFSTCFRREAGAYGQDTKGILRVHQFDKIEMFSFCQPKRSTEEHQFLLSQQEELMKLLKLPYRVVQLANNDTAAPSAGTYDIETWLPGQQQYRETHSVSNCTDWQARRLKIKYKEKQGTGFVHTLNGTAFAIGRILIAIIENYQQKDGTIKIPSALKKYLP